VWLLDAAGARRQRARGLGGELLARGLAAGAFASGLGGVRCMGDDMEEKCEAGDANGARRNVEMPRAA